MVVEEEYIKFENISDINNILELALNVDLQGVGQIEYGETPYITFDEPTTDGSQIMDMGQYFLIYY